MPWREEGVLVRTWRSEEGLEREILLTGVLSTLAEAVRSTEFPVESLIISLPDRRGKPNWFEGDSLTALVRSWEVTFSRMIG
jgi:hypothetical protein